MKIAIIVEGGTEKAFIPKLRDYLKNHLSGKMPKLDPLPCDGRIPKGERLRRDVHRLLSGKDASDHVIALTDVYTGSGSRDFQSAAEAKAKMRDWVGDEPRFHPHAAQYDFEAWLLPYWPTIQEMAMHSKSAPPGSPEAVNHNKPPSFHIKELFEAGSSARSYVKIRDASRILHKNDLSEAIKKCAELKALVNTIIELCGGEKVL